MLRLTRRYSTRIGAPLKTAQAVREFLQTPKWNPHRLLEQTDSPRAASINDSTVDRLLQLSGLQASKEEYPQIISILKEQVRFIDQLHSVEINETQQPTSSQQRLTLADLDAQIAEQKPDASKGETEGSWDPMSLASVSKNGNYIVREGLLKDK